MEQINSRFIRLISNWKYVTYVRYRKRAPMNLMFRASVCNTRILIYIKRVFCDEDGGEMMCLSVLNIESSAKLPFFVTCETEHVGGLRNARFRLDKNI